MANVEDMMELLSVLGKLNRTIDDQQKVIDKQNEFISKYIEKYGPLEGMVLQNNQEEKKEDTENPPGDSKPEHVPGPIDTPPESVPGPVDPAEKAEVSRIVESGAKKEELALATS